MDINDLLPEHCLYDTMTETVPKIRKGYSVNQYFSLSRQEWAAKQINIAKYFKY